MRCMARGSRVPLIAASSAWVCVLAEGPPDDVLQVVDGEEGSEVEVLFERVAGLDIGKKTLTVCVRTPGPRGRRAETRTFSTMTRSLGPGLIRVPSGMRHATGLNDSVMLVVRNRPDPLKATA